MGDTQDAPRKSVRKLRVRVVLLAVLVFVLVGSLVSNVLLYRQADRSYRELAEVRLDPYGLSHRFKDASTSPSPSDSLVVFFGDSRAEQWPAPDAPRWRFINRGVFGQTTEQVRGRLNAQLLPLHPRVVVLQAGINDLKAIGLFPGRRAQIVGDCESHLHEMIERCRNSGSVVIVTTIFPTGPVSLERRRYWSPQIDQAVAEVNADLRAIHADGVIVLDAWELLQEHGRLRPGYGRDTLHLTAGGYDALNRALTPLLGKINGPTTAP